MRSLAVAGVAVAAALALVLAQPFDQGQSAIARARAAVDVLPHVGIFHEVTRRRRRGGGGGVLAEPRQSRRVPPLAGRADRRPEESAVADGVWMRFDAAVNTVYTQRVIESTGAFSETENVPDLQRQLANPRIRDRGVETLAGQQVRHLELPGAQGTSDGTCEYYADASTLLPVRMACSLAGRPTFVTTYEVVADDAANRANFALTAIHPGAAVKQDPNGIPGKAGDDLAAVTASGVIDVTSGKAILQQTGEPAMRAARELEAALGQQLVSCMTTHGAYVVTNTYGELTFHDPTGTVSAICGHFGDSEQRRPGDPTGAALHDRGRRARRPSARAPRPATRRRRSRAGSTPSARASIPTPSWASLPKVE